MTDQFTKAVVSVMALLEIADARGDGRGLLTVRAKLAAMMEPTIVRVRGRSQVEVDREYAIWVSWCDRLSPRVREALGAHLRASWMSMESSRLSDPLARLDPKAVADQRQLIASRKQSACRAASTSCDRYLAERSPSHLRAAAAALLDAHAFDLAHRFRGPKPAECVEASSRISKAVSAALPHSARRWLLNKIHREVSPEEPPLYPSVGRGNKREFPAVYWLSTESMRDREPYGTFDLHVFFVTDVQNQYSGDMKSRRSSQRKAARDKIKAAAAAQAEADARERERRAELEAAEAPDSPIQEEEPEVVLKPSEMETVTMHIVVEGLTMLGKDWQLGEELTLTRESPEWAALTDTRGMICLDLTEDEQVEHYTKVCFRMGKSPGVELIKARNRKYAEAHGMPDPHPPVSTWGREIKSSPEKMAEIQANIVELFWTRARQDGRVHTVVSPMTIEEFVTSLKVNAALADEYRREMRWYFGHAVTAAQQDYDRELHYQRAGGRPRS